MTTEHKREIAKFACGAESFHVFVHAIFFFSGTTINVFGITVGPMWNIVSATVNTLIALALASYAWGIFGRGAKAGHANDKA